jgi:hypothetical protein
MTDAKKPEPPKTEAHQVPTSKKEDIYATEQTKDPKGGVGPNEKSVPTGTKPETMEDLGIGPRTPYPSKES